MLLRWALHPPTGQEGHFCWDLAEGEGPPSAARVRVERIGQTNAPFPQFLGAAPGSVRRGLGVSWVGRVMSFGYSVAEVWGHWSSVSGENF